MLQMTNYSTSVPMLVSRQFDDEIVLVNYETGIYYSLLGTGADIWLALKAGRTAANIITAFSHRYPPAAQAIASAVPAFIDQLLSEGLIATVAESQNCVAWSPIAADAFSSPVLERFDDLRDLLLLDPVHEVGDAGWPIRPYDAR
jgi:Coenzyme PQQ synthesis protein D (PqqD)